jgi:hypothetical protein
MGRMPVLLATNAESPLMGPRTALISIGRNGKMMPFPEEGFGVC